jgi:hypothetical protein
MARSAAWDLTILMGSRGHTGNLLLNGSLAILDAPDTRACLDGVSSHEPIFFGALIDFFLQKKQSCGKIDSFIVHLLRPIRLIASLLSLDLSVGLARHPASRVNVFTSPGAFGHV